MWSKFSGSWWPSTTRTKANKVRRVYINPTLDQVLRVAMEKSTGEFVFTSRRGKPYTPDGVRAVFRRAVERAEIEDFRFHDLRHTTATRLRQHGAGIDVVADVLGHATLAMARRYVHLGAETMRSAMVNLPALAEPVPPKVVARGAQTVVTQAGSACA